METFSTLLALCAGNSPVTGEFPAKRPVTWSFDVFFDLRLNKRLSKQSWGWWFETPSRPLWHHCNVFHLIRSRTHFTVTHSSDWWFHYNDVIIGAMASQIASLRIVYATIYSGCRSKKTSKLCVTDLCAGNSTVTGEFPAQMASNAEMFTFDDVIMLVQVMAVRQQTIAWANFDPDLCCGMTSLDHNVLK